MDNLDKKVVCEYKDKCKHYSFIHDTCSNKCFCCRNNSNVDQNDLKDDYYKSDNSAIIMSLVLWVCIIAFCWFVL